MAVGGNAVSLLFDGPEIYPAMHRMIAEATRRIHFENYIFRDDECGCGFADALIARARDGLTIRVLYDWIGSIGTGRALWRRMRDAGIAVLPFNPPRLVAPLSIISRDHRKTMTVDGCRGVTGGHCIGNEWAGDEARGRAPWRDTAVTIEGPGARALDATFAVLWRQAGGAAPDDADEVEADVPAAGSEVVRVVATRPGEERVWRMIDLLLGMGAERIWVTEAYLAGLPRLYHVFQDAAADGVDVRLLVPGASDLPMVRNLSRTGYRRLLRAGVRIWEWGGPMLHAKTMAIDSHWVRVGSSNLNPSSLIANWELDLFVESRDLARQLERRFVEDLARSREVVTRLRRLPQVPGIGRPTALVATQPTAPPPTGHRPGMLERRRRAYLRLTSLTQAAHLALAGSFGVGLLGFALVLAVFPRIAAYTTAAVAGTLGVALLVSALARRQRR
jgi:cardiolipin synthase